MYHLTNRFAKKSLSGIAVLFAACCFSIVNNSCTIIGYVIGSDADKANKELVIINSLQIHKIKRGKSIELICYDGRIIKGIYKGTTHQTKQQYDEEYFTFVNKYPDEKSIPKIGDSIQIYNTKTKSLQTGKFIALEVDNMLLESTESNKNFNIPLNTMEFVFYHNSKPFIPENYDSIPRITMIKIEVEYNHIMYISVNDVGQIKVDYKFKSARNITLIGLAIDISIIIGLSIIIFPLYGGGFY